MGQQRVPRRLVKGHKTSRGERRWELGIMSLGEAPGCSQVGSVSSAVTEQEEMAQLRGEMQITCQKKEKKSLSGWRGAGTGVGVTVPGDV